MPVQGLRVCNTQAMEHVRYNARAGASCLQHSLPGRPSRPGRPGRTGRTGKWHGQPMNLGSKAEFVAHEIHGG